MSTEQKNRPTQNHTGLLCLKYSLHIFNFFFVVAGIVVLLFASSAIINDHDFVSLLSSSTYPAIAYLMVITGCLVIIFSIFGCYALIKDHLPVLLCNGQLSEFLPFDYDSWSFYLLVRTLYFYFYKLNIFQYVCYVFLFMLAFIFLMESMIGAVAYIYKDSVREEMHWNLNSTFNKYYYFDQEKTDAINLLQQRYKCCGVHSFEEWYSSRWRLELKAESNFVPDSCCKSVTEHCGKSYHPSNIYYSGCITSFAKEIEYHLNYLGAISLGVSVLHIIGVMLAVFYYYKLKDVLLADT